MGNRWLMVAGLALLAACDTPPQDNGDSGMFDAARDAEHDPDGFVPMADSGLPPGCVAETCNGADDDCDGAVDEGVMAGTCAVCRTASACGHQDMADCYQRMETQLAGRGCLNADSIRAIWSTCTADCTGYLSCRDDASASCTCPAGQVFCDTSPVAYCIDLQNDDVNCGSCRNFCRDGRVCVAGICRER